MKSTTVVLVAALGLTLTGIMGCAANENSELASSEISSEAAVASEPVITVETVAEHATGGDCWSIVNANGSAGTQAAAVPSSQCAELTQLQRSLINITVRERLRKNSRASK